MIWINRCRHAGVNLKGLFPSGAGWVAAPQYGFLELIGCVSGS